MAEDDPTVSGGAPDLLTLRQTGKGSPDDPWADFSLREEVRAYEARLIGLALREAGGVVSRAARLLGFRHYQSLISLINNRHRGLLTARSPVVRRRHSIIRKDAPPEAPRGEGAVRRRGRPVTILHAEDDRQVADTVRGALEAEGWAVDTCREGAAALRKLAGTKLYDLLLLDNELPGVGGLELARLARALPHRRGVPVVMLAAGDRESEARRTGVDDFLRKPEGVAALVETLAQLIGANPGRE